MIRKLLYKTAFMVCAVAITVGCKEEEYSVPKPKSGLQNDVIKKSVGPGLPGIDMEFMYAMALQKSEGKLVSAKVEASIPGASGTYLENRSFRTDGVGNDVGVIVATPSVTTGAVSEVSFNVDTNASTLRYHYIPALASAGQEVSFTFTATSSNGQTVSYKMGPYKIRKLEIVNGIILSNTAKKYISIENMAAYTEAEAAAVADKIDVIYLQRSVPGVTFGHAFVAPTADVLYRRDVVIPAGANRNTKIQKAWNVRDIHLGANLASDGAGNSSYVYLDEEDFVALNLNAAPNYAIDMKHQSGIWVETADGKYRAYIYVNRIPGQPAGSTEFKIGIKRYTVQ